MASTGRNLKHQFILFSRLHKTIGLDQIDKWFIQAEIFDKNITATETAQCFEEFKSPRIDYSSFEKFLDELAAKKQMAAVVLKRKLLCCGLPDPSKSTEEHYKKLIKTLK